MPLTRGPAMRRPPPSPSASASNGANALPRSRPLPRRGAPRPAADALAAGDREDLERLVEVLKAVKRGDFSVRLAYREDGLLARAGELLNDVIGLDEHLANEL